MSPETQDLLNQHPELKKFMDSVTTRFAKGTTTCDGDDCLAQLTPTTFNVFITPQYTGKMLCMRCLHAYRIKHNIQFNN